MFTKRKSPDVCRFMGQLKKKKSFAYYTGNCGRSKHYYSHQRYHNIITTGRITPTYASDCTRQWFPTFSTLRPLYRTISPGHGPPRFAGFFFFFFHTAFPTVHCRSARIAFRIAFGKWHFFFFFAFLLNAGERAKIF